MSFSLGSIRAALGIDESDFVRGLINSEAAAEVFGDNVVRFVNNPLLGTVGILKDVVGGFSSLVAETARTNAEFSRWAERTGASTELLSGLAAEAGRLGVELEDVGDALKEIAVKARDSLGSEDLAGTFKRLGVAIVDSSGKLRNAEDIFLDVADGLKNLANETERVAIADELLSDVGTRLLPILASGSQGISEMVAEARKFGLVVDNEAAQASKRFEQRLNEVQAALDGVKRSNATAFIEGFSASLEQSEGLIADLTERINQALNPALREMGEIIGRIADNGWIEDAIEGIVELTTLLNRVLDVLEKIEKVQPFDLGDFASGSIRQGSAFTLIKETIDLLFERSEGVPADRRQIEQNEQIIEERRRANQRQQRATQT